MYEHSSPSLSSELDPEFTDYFVEMRYMQGPRGPPPELPPNVHGTTISMEDSTGVRSVDDESATQWDIESQGSTLCDLHRIESAGELRLALLEQQRAIDETIDDIYGHGEDVGGSLMDDLDEDPEPMYRGEGDPITNWIDDVCTDTASGEEKGKAPETINASDNDETPSSTFGQSWPKQSEAIHEQHLQIRKGHRHLKSETNIQTNSKPELKCRCGRWSTSKMQLPTPSWTAN